MLVKYPRTRECSQILQMLKLPSDASITTVELAGPLATQHSAATLKSKQLLQCLRAEK